MTSQDQEGWDKNGLDDTDPVTAVIAKTGDGRYQGSKRIRVLSNER